MAKITSKMAYRTRKNTKRSKMTTALFSVTNDDFEAFKAVCKKEGKTFSKVIDEFMRVYVKTAKGG